MLDASSDPYGLDLTIHAQQMVEWAVDMDHHRCRDIPQY